MISRVLHGRGAVNDKTKQKSLLQSSVPPVQVPHTTPQQMRVVCCGIGSLSCVEPSAACVRVHVVHSMCTVYRRLRSIPVPDATLFHLFSMRSQPSLGLDADVRLPPKCPFTDRARDRARGFERGRSESMVGTAAKGKGTGACAGGLCRGARVSDLLPCAHQC